VAEAERVSVETFGLGPEALELICGVFRRHPEIHEVKIFGSRARGCFEKNSDVDLALWGDLDLGLVARIRGELDELPLPHVFDIQAYATIRHAPLRQHIDEVGKTLYQRQTAS